MTDLTDLALTYGCDKLHSHSYIPAYEQILAGRTVRRLLEIGIGYRDLMEPFVPHYVHGASLHMWADYFPEAQIYACDIREDTLINDGRIHSMVCDQSSGASLASMVFEFTDGLLEGFDVIIDDGSHVLEHQVFTAECLLPRLNAGGVYVIEDTYPDKGAWLAEMFKGKVIIGAKRPDDCMVVITR